MSVLPGRPSDTSTSSAAPTPDGTVHVTAVAEIHETLSHFLVLPFPWPLPPAGPRFGNCNAGVMILISSGTEETPEWTSAKSLPYSVITVPPDVGEKFGDTDVMAEPSY
jgi:hypothetical protein